MAMPCVVEDFTLGSEILRSNRVLSHSGHEGRVPPRTRRSKSNPQSAHVYSYIGMRRR